MTSAARRSGIEPEHRALELRIGQQLALGCKQCDMLDHGSLPALLLGTSSRDTQLGIQAVRTIVGDHVEVQEGI